MGYFAGVDAGGSKTECLVGDEAQVLGRALRSSCKIQIVGQEQARNNLQRALRDACRDAGIDSRQLTRVCIGIAGVSQPGIAEQICAFVAELTPAETLTVGDHVIAYQAALGQGEGVLVISGTGSIAYGRDSSGKEARAGGLAPVSDDAGSASWIVARALREALLRQDLRDDPTKPAQLFPQVVSACDAGNDAACALLRAAGDGLALLATNVIEQLWPDGDEAVAVRVGGGVFRYSKLVRQSFAERLKRLRPAVNIDLKPIEPPEGALAIARRGGS
jgi:glucosamine kinase